MARLTGHLYFWVLLAIVVGGTIGAVAVQFSSKALKQALRDVKLIFKPVPVDHGAAGGRIAWATSWR